MENNFYTRLQLLRKSGDYIIINLSFFIAYFLKFGVDLNVFATNNYLSFLLFFNLAWVIASSVLRTYAYGQANVTTLRTLDYLTRVVLLHLLLVVAFNGVIKTYFSRLFILYAYLSNDDLQNIDELILGCTHYPLIKEEIKKYYDGKVTIIDSPTIVAKQVYTDLLSNNMLSNSKEAKYDFYISDLTDSFEASAGRFIHYKNIVLNEIKLWDSPTT